MSRRKRRERPATPEEQRQVEQFASLAADALAASTLDARRAAYGRMRRVADQLRDRDSFAALSARELHDVLAERCPDSQDQVRNR